MRSTSANARAAQRRRGTLFSTVKVATAFVVEAMRVEHIPAVSAIEKLSFPQPWPQNAYRREILENRMAHYVVARRLNDEHRLGNPAADESHAAPAQNDFI